jgi:hypothetical protein
MNNQEFLNRELRDAVGDVIAAQLVFMQYQYAAFYTVEHFQACENCKQDLTLLKKRAGKLRTLTQTYINAISMLPNQHAQFLLTESKTLSHGVEELCEHCRNRLQQSILMTFRDLRQV